MKLMAIRQYSWIYGIVLAMLLAGELFSAVNVDPLQEIAKNFPDSVRVKKDGMSTIEFCHDNTCDAFVAKKQVSLENLKDFVYLYVFFYSDYYVLDNWRNKETAKAIVRQTLLKPQYQQCNKTSLEDTAQCILIQLSRKEQITLIAVRYDESQRNVVKRNLSAILSKAPIALSK